MKPVKAVVIGDTHRHDGAALTVLEKEKPFDILIHTGDCEDSEEIYELEARECGAECRMVRGNNDDNLLPLDTQFCIGPYRTFLTHGHMHRVSLHMDGLLDEVRQESCQILIYGHTHRPLAQNMGGVIVCNPGSISFPRQENRVRTYMVITVDENGKLNYELKAARNSERI